MKAIRQYEFGGPDVLRHEDVPDPVPGPGQALVRVTVAGAHLVDTTLRSGSAEGPPLPALPTTPGREVAGVVVAGPADWTGRRVVAHLGQGGGGYAELAAVSVGSLHALPDQLSDEAAVTLVGTGRTALAVLELAGPGPDDVVLVPGAAGALGALLVQAARRAGAYTVGLASPAKLRYVDADAAVDYTAPDWPDAVRSALAGREVTVLLDGVGGQPGRTAFELVGVGGRVVLFGWAAGAPFELSVADLYRQGLTVSCAIGPRIFRRPGGLRAWEEEALALGASGAWTPLVGPAFALSDAAGAHRALEGRTAVGKTVLVP